MKHLIDKAAVVAAVKTIYNEDYKFLSSDLVESVRDFKDDLLTALDGLSTVKEVDLEKEVDDYVNEYFSECDDGVLISDANSMELTLLDITPLAKHFFELGMCARNPITAADRGIADEIIFALNTLGKEKMISYDKEIEWVMNKVKEGEEV